MSLQRRTVVVFLDNSVNVFIGTATMKNTLLLNLDVVLGANQSFVASNKHKHHFLF